MSVSLGFLLAVAMVVSACQTATRGLPQYDPTAVQRTAELKVETRNLMEQSGQRYSRHASDVEALTLRIEQASAAAATMPDNQLIVQQWAVLKNPDGALYGGFAKRWKEKGTVNKAFREEMIGQVAAGYDYILCLERAKLQPVQCSTGAAQ